MKRLAILGFLWVCTVHAEPLSEFEVIAKRCKKAFDTRPPVSVVHLERMNVWVKRVYGPSELKYDVRKTDSLVSPVIAFIDITESVASGRAPEEGAARDLDISVEKQGQKFVTRLNYVYQDKLWALVDGSDSDSGELQERSAKRSLKSLRGQGGALLECFTS